MSIYNFHENYCALDWYRISERWTLGQGENYYAMGSPAVYSIIRCSIEGAK